jgi:hypothetical protein
VNGKLVLNGEKHTSAKPGRALRRKSHAIDRETSRTN